MKKIEIERLEEKTSNDKKEFTRKFKKSILPAELIDRVAVFTVDRLGFRVYICLKGNIHEYTRTNSTGI